MIKSRKRKSWLRGRVELNGIQYPDSEYHMGEITPGSIGENDDSFLNWRAHTWAYASLLPFFKMAYNN